MANRTLNVVKSKKNDTISSESTTNSTDSELIPPICNVVHRMLSKNLLKYKTHTQSFLKINNTEFTNDTPFQKIRPITAINAVIQENIKTNLKRF